MSTVNARVNPTVKKEAENILRELGIKPSNAINMFYKQIILNNGLPFPVVIPDDETAYVSGNSELMKQIVAGIDSFQKGDSITNPPEVMDAIDSI